jgi:hypothetical protein
LTISDSIFSANSKPYSKRLSPMNQGPRGDFLMKKTDGRKSRDTVPLSWFARMGW